MALALKRTAIPCTARTLPGRSHALPSQPEAAPRVAPPRPPFPAAVLRALLIVLLLPLCFAHPAAAEPRRAWPTLDTSDGLPSNSVQAIVQDRKGNLWFGTDEGLAFFPVEKQTGFPDGSALITRVFTTKDGLGSDDVLSLAVDGQGRVWCGTVGGGVSVREGTRWRTYTPKDGLGSDTVWSLAVDGQGRLWCGTWGGGVSVRDGTRWRTYTTKDGLGSDTVRSLAVDGQGRVWCGTDGGGVSVLRLADDPGWIQGVWGVRRWGVTLAHGVQPSRPNDALRSARWSYREAGTTRWSAPVRNPQRWWSYLHLPAGLHQFEVRAWDGKTNPPATFLIEFEVSGEERALALGLYALGPLGLAGWGLFALGRRQAARVAVRRGFNPYQAGLPVEGNMFFGREALVTGIVGDLDKHCVLLTGERRIGKSSVLLAVARRLADPQPGDPQGLAPCRLSLEEMPEERFWISLAKAAHATYRARPNAEPLELECEAGADAKYDERGFRGDLGELVQALQKGAAHPVRLVFLLDEVDAFNTHSQQLKSRLRALFQSPTLRPYLRCLMVGRHLDLSAGDDATFSPPFNYLHPSYTLRGLTPADLLRLIREPVRGYYHYEAGVAEKVAALAEDRPLAAQALCKRLVAHAYEARGRVIRMTDLEAVQEGTLAEVAQMLQADYRGNTIPTSLPEAMEEIALLQRELTDLREENRTLRQKSLRVRT